MDGNRRDGPASLRDGQLIRCGQAHLPVNPSTRRALRRRGIAHSIPEKRDQRAHRRTRGSAGGRPPKFDRDRYKQRNVVERCFNRLKQFRALATRYAKRAAYYRATLLLVSTVLWLRA